MRLPAEWERQSLVQIVFPHKKSDWKYCIEEISQTYVEIITTITRYQPCLVICDQIKRVEKLLPKSKNIIYAQIKTNDTWIRDFGGIDVFKRDKILTLDFDFNGWGLKFDSSLDNKVTKKLYKKKLLKNKQKKIDMILEGGSIDSNGKGILLTTSKCLLEKNRNAHLSKTQIEKKLKKLFGLKKILWLNHGALIGDDTDSHIDTLARFVDEKTIAYVKCKDKKDEHFEKLNKMEKELQEFGYDLLPLPLPRPKHFKNHRLPATYANFLFVNGAVLVPTYSDPNDKNALKLFEKIFPNRDIVGINCEVLIREHGSLHCATMNKFI